MSDFAWILWTVLGVILIIAEVFTPGFVLLWFGVGALAAALASIIGFGLFTNKARRRFEVRCRSPAGDDRHGGFFQ
jgi:membrane-bound ClpP family serine protease